LSDTQSIEAGTFLRLIAFVYHSSRGLRVIAKRRRREKKVDLLLNADRLFEIIEAAFPVQLLPVRLPSHPILESSLQ